MRLHIVTDTFPPEVNGVARTLQRLVDGLRAKKHQIEVIRPGYFVSRKGDSYLFYSLPFPGYSPLRLGLPCKLKFLRLWKQDPPEVVYVATESPFGFSAISAARLLGIPVVSGYHTNFQLYAEEYRLGALRKMASSYLRNVHNRTCCTFAPAEDIGAGLEAQGYENVRLLGRGVDAELFHSRHRDTGLRKSWGVADSGVPVVIVVGRLAREKNLGLAMEAFKKIRELSPGARCVVAGDGPLRNELEKMYPDTIFTGMLYGNALARHYASADVFLFPSLTETFGNVLLEALASGLVTVSFKYAASAQFVLHPENGFQAPFGDAGAFVASALDAAAACRDQALRENARKSAERVSWARVTGQFEADLHEIIRDSSDRPTRPTTAGV